MVLLGTAIFPASLLFAQFDPVAVPASQTQPNRPQQQMPSTTSMQDSGPNAGDVGQIMVDKMFLRSAAEAGIAEVKLGQLATQKGSSDEVKSFGQKMADDHATMNQEMAQIADSMGVMLPKTMNKEDQAEYEKLNALSGNDFDMEYLSLMVRTHHKDLHAFRIEAASHSGQVLHDEVVKAEGIIHEHLVMVDKLAHEKGVPIPAHNDNHHTPAPAM
jgi:putative membrane protein